MTFPPMDASSRGAVEEVIQSQAGEGVGCDRRRRKGEVVICDGRTAVVDASAAAAAAAVENWRSRTGRREREGDATGAAAAVTTAGRLEVEDAG